MTTQQPPRQRKPAKQASKQPARLPAKLPARQPQPLIKTVAGNALARRGVSTKRAETTICTKAPGEYCSVHNRNRLAPRGANAAIAKNPFAEAYDTRTSAAHLIELNHEAPSEEVRLAAALTLAKKIAEPATIEDLRAATQDAIDALLRSLYELAETKDLIGIVMDAIDVIKAMNRERATELEHRALTQGIFEKGNSARNQANFARDEELDFVAPRHITFHEPDTYEWFKATHKKDQ